jgi:hypothetical protein
VQLVAHIAVKNTSDHDISVKVKAYEIDVIENTMNMFCWANNCYPPGTAVSPKSDTLAPGELNETGFSGDYVPNSILGTSKVMYTFFDENSVNDSASVVISFISGYAGLPDGLLEQITFSNPYPNPANASVHFDYSFPAGIRDAKLEIHNLLGSVVKETRISERQGHLIIDTGDLREGMYFYTLVAGQQSVKAGKLIIKR